MNLKAMASHSNQMTLYMESYVHIFKKYGWQILQEMQLVISMCLDAMKPTVLPL